MNGSSTLSTADRLWIRLNCWNTKPIFLRRKTSCSTSFMAVMVSPSIAIVPEVGRSSAPSR